MQRSHYPAIRLDNTVQLSHYPATRLDNTVQLSHYPATRHDSAVQLSHYPTTRHDSAVQLSHYPATRHDSTVQLSHYRTTRFDNVAPCSLCTVNDDSPIQNVCLFSYGKTGSSCATACVMTVVMTTTVISISGTMFLWPDMHSVKQARPLQLQIK